MLFGQVIRGMSAGARVFEYMDLKPSVPLVGGAKIPVGEVEGRVKFSGVWFSYPTRSEQVIVGSECGG